MGSTKAHGVIIRNLEQEDLSLLEKWYKMPDKFGYATRFRDFSLVKSRILDVKNQDKIVFMIDIRETGETTGFIFAEVKKTVNKQVLWIYTLLISPEHRHEGYGTDAVNILFKKVKAKYGKMACMVSVARDNTVGLSFWRKLGFEPARLNPKQKPSNVEILIKEI